MRYNPRARLDRSQIENRRGGGGGGLGFPVGGGGRGMKVGGGVGGLVVLLIIFLLQSQLGGGTSPDQGSSGAADDSFAGCVDGADANRNPDCALVANVNSIQSYWSETLPDQAGVQYTRSKTVPFTGQTQTGCGAGTSDAGPFYCPADQNVYLDTTFFDDMLEGQLGARGGPFSVAYVLAHEYGHHVQDLLGTLGKVRTQQGADSDAVRLELQADCYAGMWAQNATRAPDAGGEPFIIDLTKDDISRALDAARAVGDDRIQQRTSGRVNPDQWTHGSAEQRMRWFTTGMTKGTLQACDTFTASRL